jgi:integrase
MLDACSPGYRTLIATALYTGMRNSELLGLTFFSAERKRVGTGVRGHAARRLHGR